MKVTIFLLLKILRALTLSPFLRNKERKERIYSCCNILWASNILAWMFVLEILNCSPLVINQYQYLLNILDVLNCDYYFFQINALILFIKCTLIRLFSPDLPCKNFRDCPTISKKDRICIHLCIGVNFNIMSYINSQYKH